MSIFKKFLDFPNYALKSLDKMKKSIRKL